MDNVIKHGPLDAPTINDAPNPSNLDSITDANTAQPIEGHDVRLRYPLSEIRNANE